MGNSNKSSIWLLIALIAFLGLSAFLWFQNNQLSSKLSAHETELFELEKVNSELDQDYQAALANLEEFRGENNELNNLIDSQKKELSTQKDKINNLIWSKRELGKAREEIAQISGMMTQNMAEITTLREENTRLTNQNKKLKTEKVQLSNEVNREREINTELSEAKTVLVSQKEKLDKSNEVLSSKVDMAMAIKINWMEVKGYEVKDDGKLKKKSKGKDMDLIRTCFRTESNFVADPGGKTFFVRLIDPQGETVYVESGGSGVLTNKLDNSQVRYTTSGEIEYNNDDAEGCVDWTAGYKLAKGMYDVQMYNNGFMVGKGTFKVK